MIIRYKQVICHHYFLTVGHEILKGILELKLIWGIFNSEFKAVIGEHQFIYGETEEQKILILTMKI